MKAFLSSCHFLVLLFPAVAFQECYDNSGGYAELAPFCSMENGSCFSNFIRNRLHGFRRDVSVVGCATNCTSGNYSFTTADGYLQSIFECCNGFLCNDDIYSKRARGGVNGRKCEACRVSGSERCPDLNTIECYGAETQCISFVIVRNDSLVPDVTYKGCATPSFCELAKTSLYNKYFSGTITKARCCDSLPSSEQLNLEGLSMVGLQSDWDSQDP